MSNLKPYAYLINNDNAPGTVVRLHVLIPVSMAGYDVDLECVSEPEASFNNKITIHVPIVEKPGEIVYKLKHRIFHFSPKIVNNETLYEIVVGDDKQADPNRRERCKIYVRKKDLQVQTPVAIS